MEKKLDKKLRVKLYKEMVKIRIFEDRIDKMVRTGELYGFYHLCTGEEACAVGACLALNKEDYITSTHRGHGHVIAKGMRLDRMIAELMAKETGYNKAKGGSMHLASPEFGILGANGIIGAGIPIGTGAAWSSKYLNNGRVCICFFGDAAINQGTFYESVNMAAAFKWPCVYFCENNLYAVGTRSCTVTGTGEDLAVKAKAFGIPGKVVDGNDVEAVYFCVKEAVERARKGDGPTLIEAKTYRWGCHHNAEKDTYRPPQEVEDWKKKCPIKRYTAILLKEGVLKQSDIQNTEQEVHKEIDAAVEFARNSKRPPLESALEDVYAD